ncbi:hypothetical protein B0A55_06612 [Friedmanniomyces simplex]|uniref:Uncharacterized protein n=1 Tax=Friedmanniomyces simplex TaxID=329884 RepID=A0A4U0WYQ9_9PEZI|nr:hypothetical protein B0A55_06612 [Friedmanniomyces simplex]
MAHSKKPYASVASAPFVPSDISSVFSSPTPVFDSPPPAPVSPGSANTPYSVRSPQKGPQDQSDGHDNRNNQKEGAPLATEAEREAEIGNDEGDTERMRFLNELQIMEAAKLAALIGRYVTMRAAMVLIGNETHAIRTLQAWLITPTIRNDVNARNILQHVQRTLGHLIEAHRVLQAGLVSRDVVASPMASLLQGVRKLLDDTEHDIISHVNTIATAQTSMKPDEAVQRSVELTSRSNLDATAKDLAAVEVALSPAARY